MEIRKGPRALQSTGAQRPKHNDMRAFPMVHGHFFTHTTMCSAHQPEYQCHVCATDVSPEPHKMLTAGAISISDGCL
jgi:hypothetical protein